MWNLLVYTSFWYVVNVRLNRLSTDHVSYITPFCRRNFFKETRGYLWGHQRATPRQSLQRILGPASVTWWRVTWRVHTRLVDRLRVFARNARAAGNLAKRATTLRCQRRWRKAWEKVANSRHFVFILCSLQDSWKCARGGGARTCTPTVVHVGNFENWIIARIKAIYLSNAAKLSLS